MAERRNRPVSPEQKDQDRVIKNRRIAYSARVLPLVGSVLQEDGYMQDVLKDLSLQQKEVFFDLIASQVALVKFGRTHGEDTYPIRHKDGAYQHVDPVYNRYSRRLREVGMGAFSEYSGMVSTMVELIETAANTDPLFDLAPQRS